LQRNPVGPVSARSRYPPTASTCKADPDSKTMRHNCAEILQPISLRPLILFDFFTMPTIRLLLESRLSRLVRLQARQVLFSHPQSLYVQDCRSGGACEAFHRSPFVRHEYEWTIAWDLSLKPQTYRPSATSKSRSSWCFPSRPINPADGQTRSAKRFHRPRCGDRTVILALGVMFILCTRCRGPVWAWREIVF
jgi:hypothetical protein